MEYEYTRELVNGAYDINYPGRETTLAQEIAIELPGKDFTICADDTVCKIDFTVELTAGEKTTLDTTVSNHKNNV
jgi:hypothetical protein